MLIFGHTALTLGAAVVLSSVLGRRHHPAIKVNGLEGQRQPSLRMPPAQNSISANSWLYSLANRIDIRLLLIGSLLPDIIDKPVGQFLFRNTFSNGRIFSHTLLFLILITLGGLYLYYSRKKKWLLVLSFGTCMHLVLDGMWLTPQTLLWPLYGFSFERLDLSYWGEGLFHNLLTKPLVWISELVGILLISWFVWLLVRKGAIGTFIRKGRT